MKLHAPEHARVIKYKLSPALDEDEVVVFPRRIVRRFDPQFTTHAQMNAEPALPVAAGESTARKTEKHLLAGGRRSEERGASEFLCERRGIGASENFFSWVQSHRHDPGAVAAGPPLPEKLNFGEFGHGPGR